MMMGMPSLVASACCAFLLIGTVTSFSVKHVGAELSRVTNPSTTTTSLYLNNAADRYFQLEESEDQETSTSEVFLNADKSIFFGESDGPPPAQVSGNWDQQPDGTFTMNLSRTFKTGQPATEWTDMGEFSFTVERKFEGTLDQVGASMAISGSIYDKDEVFGDRRVGFFNMIDTTDAKLDKNANQGIQFGRTQTSR